MTILRVYADGDGSSFIDDVELPLAPMDYAPPAPSFDLSAPLAASRALLSAMPAGWFGDWHPSPVRQLYVALSGELEVVVSSGARVIVRPGHIVLVEDTHGRGHTTRVLGEEPARGIFIHLAEEG